MKIAAMKAGKNRMAARTKTLLVTALFGALTLMSAHAADITPAETKAIAEEGFIYGLPIVMNYAVAYEYSVDKNSGQYKAPFNQIKNEARVFTYKDTSVMRLGRGQLEKA